MNYETLQIIKEKIAQLAVSLIEHRTRQRSFASGMQGQMFLERLPSCLARTLPFHGYHNTVSKLS